jgi:hypothetical protein
VIGGLALALACALATSISFLLKHRGAIVGGIVVFRDPIGRGALEIIGRILAFCLVIAGAALIPAPVWAADAAS